MPNEKKPSPRRADPRSHRHAGTPGLSRSTLDLDYRGLPVPWHVAHVAAPLDRYFACRWLPGPRWAVPCTPRAATDTGTRDYRWIEITDRDPTRDDDYRDG